MTVMRRHNHTVMSGRVVRFAEDFDNPDATFPNSPTATGAFDVSASRDGVSVHHCWLCDEYDKNDFIRAIKLAWSEHLSLKSCDGRPDDEDDGKPREV